MSDTSHPLDTLHGGPFDGLYLVDEHYCEEYIYVSAGQCRVAVYERSETTGLLEFTKYRPTGEGCMPDIRPDRREASQ